MSGEEVRELEDLTPEPPQSTPSIEQMLAATNGNQTPMEVGSNVNN
jgi:hypothetical protein